MRTKWKLFVLLLAILIPSFTHAESLRKKVNEGLEKYNKGDYEASLKDFTDALVEHPLDARVKFNLAGTYYKMGNYEEAEKVFNQVVEEGDDVLREKAMYGLGNTLYRQGKLMEAVDMYKKALELDPDDEDARYNLELVQKEIQRRMNEAKKREEEQKKQGEEGDKQCPNPQTGGEMEGERRDEQRKEGGERGKEGERKGGEQEERKPMGGKEMTKEEAQRWLNSLTEDQKEFLKKQIIRGMGGEYRLEKDW